MRAAALAAFTAVGLAALSGTAFAKTVTDPQGRFTFEAPNAWTTSNEARGADFSYMIAGNANNECHVLGFPSPNLVNATARNVKRTGANSEQFNAAFWTNSANAVGSVFPNNSAQVQSTALDETTFWPIQRAEIRSATRLVHASLTLRPGLELYTYCQTYDGADPVAAYETLSRSLHNSNDATWQAEAEQQQQEHDAAAAAAAAAPPPPPPPPAQEGNRRRRN